MKKPGLFGFLKACLTPAPPPPPEDWFTPRAQRVLEISADAGATPTIKDVATALIDFKDGVHYLVLQRCKVDFPSLRAAVDADQTATSVNDALIIAFEECRNLAHTWLGTEHLLLATVRFMPAVASFLEKEGLDLETLRAEILRELDPNFQTDDNAPD
ncbi:MAG TPA: Clp protease N-terminal domain-containing protein [Verrucomicrobiae bacterium]|nr:Clp protease N-terminal domain-containing protein [Verrucomicrobiae bacterium]